LFSGGPVSFAQLAHVEQVFLDSAKEADQMLFNVQKKVTKPHPFGYQLSEETKQKQSAAKSGENHPDNRKDFEFLSPRGERYHAHGLKEFCAEHRLDLSAMSRVWNGKQRAHRGWRKYVEELGGNL
jgi:hypothetical protein